MIQSLIDKSDNFEVIRDEIAAILKVEVENQKALAAAAGKEPDLWDLRIFVERSNPWEAWLNSQSEAVDTTPIINIWYDNSSFDRKASNATERQFTTGIFNIDCYGYGVSKDDPSGGHKPGDREAAYEVQRALRLVRNILMAAQYLRLGLPGLVGDRWPQSISTFQPPLDARQAQQVIGARIALNVTFNEFSPQYEANVVELVSTNVYRAEDGEIVLQAEYDYTTP